MLLRLAVSVIGFFCPQAGQARTFFIDKKVSKKSSHADPAFARFCPQRRAPWLALALRVLFSIIWLKNLKL
jgi:hypothetical protein